MHFFVWKGERWREEFGGMKRGGLMLYSAWVGG